MIDCSNLTDVEVDPEARTVRVGAGRRVSDVLSATQEHGLAIACGSAAHNGVAGSTLGGVHESKSLVSQSERFAF